MSTAKKWFAAASVTAFISAISFFQINSYWADQNNFNGVWTASGVVFCLAAIFCMWKVSQNSNKGGGN